MSHPNLLQVEKSMSATSKPQQKKNAKKWGTKEEVAEGSKNGNLAAISISGQQNV